MRYVNLFSERPPTSWDVQSIANAMTNDKNNTVALINRSSGKLAKIFLLRPQPHLLFPSKAKKYCKSFREFFMIIHCRI